MPTIPMVVLSALGLREIRYKNIQSRMSGGVERWTKHGKCLDKVEEGVNACKKWLYEPALRT